LGHAADAMAIERGLGDVPGILKVVADVAKRQVSVLYDATDSDYRSLVTALEETGFPPLDNRWSRLKAGWYQYSDTNARESAQVRPSACCNKPSK
jgi:copper chaperone CopZ